MGGPLPPPVNKSQQQGSFLPSPIRDSPIPGSNTLPKACGPPLMGGPLPPPVGGPLPPPVGGPLPPPVGGPLPPPVGMIEGPGRPPSGHRRETFAPRKDFSGFHKSTRMCLHAIREAVLHHRWREATRYLEVYSQVLEETSVEQPIACEIIWRLGIEILRHNPDSDLERFNDLYERMKSSGVKNYSKICLEYAFHLMLNGHIQKAKQQLTVAASWRYGKESARQALGLKLIHAYCGLLDYLIWSTKRASTSNAEEGEQHNEMHSYFRKALVTMQEIIKQPGVWDQFVCSCVDMLEYYNNEEEALQLLQHYAFNKDFKKTRISAFISKVSDL